MLLSHVSKNRLNIHPNSRNPKCSITGLSNAMLLWIIMLFDMTLRFSQRLDLLILSSPSCWVTIILDTSGFIYIAWCCHFYLLHWNIAFEIMFWMWFAARFYTKNFQYGPGLVKMCLMTYANNKGADQPAHPPSLISTFVVRCLDSMTCILVISKVSRF